MTPQTILQGARVAELRHRANVLAALVRPPPALRSPRLSARHGLERRRFLLALARERRRSARLIAELAS
jgi:lambda repressor-like predicted transcriptional regulator